MDAVMENPAIGVSKKGKLAGVFVYKFSEGDQDFLLAYTVNDEKREVNFLGLGTHENFYRDLER